MERLSPDKYRDPVWDATSNAVNNFGMRQERRYQDYVKAKYVKHVYTGFAYQKQSSSYINRRFLKAFRPILDVEDAFCGNTFADHVIGFQGECESQILVYMPYLSAERILKELETRPTVIQHCLENGINISILEDASWHNLSSLVEFTTGIIEPWGKSDEEWRSEIFGIHTEWREESIPVELPAKKVKFNFAACYNSPNAKEYKINVVTFFNEPPKASTN